MCLPVTVRVLKPGGAVGLILGKLVGFLACTIWEAVILARAEMLILIMLLVMCACIVLLVCKLYYVTALEELQQHYNDFGGYHSHNYLRAALI